MHDATELVGALFDITGLALALGLVFRVCPFVTTVCSEEGHDRLLLSRSSMSIA